MAEKLGIAGSGTIATGLAAVASITGEVILWARSDASAERATAAIEKAASRLEGADTARVTVTTDLTGLGAATYLVEAVSEDYDVKTPLLKQLAELAGPDAILSTTTSSLSIEKLAELSGLGTRFVGLHVFNPVPLMKLVEVIFPPRPPTPPRNAPARWSRRSARRASRCRTPRASWSTACCSRTSSMP